jgi:HAE1 family hydrophobic/amphiphilic exporter-1
MSSISGRFLFQFGLTSTVAILVSLLVSFTLTPMMSARLLRAEADPAGGAKSRRGFYAHIDRFYSRVLGWSMRHRWLVVCVAVLVVLSSIPLYKGVKQEFIPTSVDEGEFEIRVTAAEGTSLTSMNEVAKKIEADLKDIPAIRLVYASAGGGGFAGSVNGARFYVQLQPHGERVFSWGRLLHWPPWKAFQGNISQRQVMQQVRGKLKAYSHLRVSVRNPQTFNLGGPNFDIDFAILGPELPALMGYAEQLRIKAPELGLIDADTTLKLDKPEYQVEIDRDRTARLGVDSESIATALRLMVGGDVKVSRFRDPTVNDDYYVQLRLKDGDRNDPGAISRLFVPGQSNTLVRLDNLVKIVARPTASRIDRLDRQRMVALRASVAPGFAMADRIAVLKAEAEGMNLPPGYTTRVSGQARELEKTFVEFLWAFALSVVLMYLILAS